MSQLTLDKIDKLHQNIVSTGYLGQQSAEFNKKYKLIADRFIESIVKDPEMLLAMDKLYENNIKDLPKFKKMLDEDLQMYEKHLENVYKKCKHSDDASEKKNKETPLVNKISQ